MNLLAKRGLSLERLQGFLDFAAAGSLIKAASGDAVRQSQLSRQLRDLEEFFGSELVARRGRGLVLTEAGRQLASLIREQFKSLEDFQAGCEAAPVTLSLASARTIINYVVIPHLRPNLIPGVSLDLLHEFSSESASAVAEGRYDLCIIDRLPLPRTLSRQNLGKITYSLYVPKPLAGDRRLTLRDALKRLPLALPAAGRIREAIATVAGANAVSVLGLPGFDSCLDMLRTNRYAAALPDVAMAPAKAKGFIRLPLDAIGIKPREYFLAWNKRAANSRPALARAIEILGRKLVC